MQPFNREKIYPNGKQHLTQVRALERRIAKLEAAVAKEHSHAITIRNQWFEILNSCKRMRPYGRRSSKKADMMEKGPSVQKTARHRP